MSALDDHLKKHRQQIIAREENTFRAMLSAYSEIEKELKKSYTDFQQKILDAQDTGEEISPSWFFRESRLKNMLAKVNEQIVRFGGKVTPIIKREQQKAIKIGVSQSQENIKFIAKASGVKNFAGGFNTRAVETAAGMMGDGSPLADYFEQQLAPMVADRIKSEVIKAAAIGTDFKKISNRLTETGQITKFRAFSVARTEVNRVRRETVREIYKDNPNTEEWEWVASKSERTCVLCLALDGSKFPIDKPFPQHINCRCTLIPVLKGLKPLPRIIGKDWFEAQSDEIKEKILGKETFQAYRDHNLNLDDFVTFRNDKRFGQSVAKKPLAKVLADKGIHPPPNSPKGPKTPPTPAAPATPKIPKTTVPDFKNIKEAQKWVEAKYPHMEFDFTQTKVEALQPTIKEFVRLSDTYPAVNARLEYMGTYRDKTKKFNTKNGFRFSGEIAHASINGKRIGLSPSFYYKPDEMRKALEYSKSKNWLVSDEMASPFTHEFGHHIQNWLKSVENHSLTDFADSTGRFSLKRILDKFYEKFHQDLRYKTGSSLADWKKRKDELAVDVSRYGVTKESELWAESFAAITYRPTSKRAQFLEQFLNEVTKLNLNPNPKPTAGAAPAEILKAENILNDILKKFEFIDNFK